MSLGPSVDGPGMSGLPSTDTLTRGVGSEYGASEYGASEYGAIRGWSRDVRVTTASTDT